MFKAIFVVPVPGEMADESKNPNVKLLVVSLDEKNAPS